MTERWKLVPEEPTPAMLAAAALAVIPMVACQADMALAREAAKTVLMGMETRESAEMVTASIANMPAFYRAMLGAAPVAPSAVAPSEPRFVLQIDHRLIDCDTSHKVASDELKRSRIHGPDVRTIDALEEALARAKAAERDFIQVHKNCIAAREEVARLTVAPVSVAPIADEQIIAAFSNGGGSDEIPTRQPHAPFLTNEQIVWVVRRYLAGTDRG